MTLKSNFFKYLCFVLLLGAVGGCATYGERISNIESACLASQEAEPREVSPEAYNDVDDLLTVDCLLPGQDIQIGMYQHWVTPPRPAVISAWECKVQNGQYAKTTDKDGRETALKVWQGCADQGDKVAQNYMGEIYNRSWGEIKPDFVRAAEWYRKSAEQGYSRALNNLGFLYEHGLGVPKDKRLAQELSRKAIGEVKSIKLDQSVKSEINELQSKLDQALQTTEALKKELSESKEIIQRRQEEIEQERFKQQRGGTAVDQRALKKWQEELAQSRRRESALQDKLSDTQQELDGLRNKLTKTETRAALKDIPDMGKYYALIIGINNYQSPLPDLATPVKDAKRVAQVLKEKYGFETVLLVDDGPKKPTRNAIFGALADLREKLRHDDNLLIYFAGHGEFFGGSGYWLAQDAQEKNLANWLSTDDLTKNIQYLPKGGGLKARHVLVVADSCYGAAMAMSWLETSKEQIAVSLPQGLTTRSAHSTYSGSRQVESAPLLQFDEEPAENRLGIIKRRYELPSRAQLSSGGLEPVIDQEFRNGLSVFANAFTEALEANEEIISARNIHSIIEPQVFDRVYAMGMKQAPVYQPILGAGGNNGEFFFVPRKTRLGRP